MSRIVSDEVARLDLGDGEWVDLKARMSVGDYEAIAIGGKSNTQEGLIVSTLVVNIKAWCMKNEGGQQVDCTLDNITHLDNITAVEIFQKIGALNKKPKKAPTKTS